MPWYEYSVATPFDDESGSQFYNFYSECATIDTHARCQ